MPSQETNIVTGTGYIKTVPGFCKIIQGISSFFGVLLVGLSFVGPKIALFESAAIISMITAVILLILFITGLPRKIKIAWSRILFCFEAVFTIYYLIAASLILSSAGPWLPLYLGGTFGIFATVAHLMDAVDIYRKQL